MAVTFKTFVRADMEHAAQEPQPAIQVKQVIEARGFDWAAAVARTVAENETRQCAANASTVHEAIPARGLSESLKVAASTAGGGAAGTAGSLAAVSILGAVEGLSAAGMTSGLATLGSLVGGGMAAGIGVAAAPVLACGALAAALTSDSIETDEKIVAGVGAGAGMAGSIATVSAAGAVGGLSAAGITSGLASIGGVVGGGMATGVAITFAAPLAVAGSAYALYKWLKD